MCVVVFVVAVMYSFTCFFLVGVFISEKWGTLNSFPRKWSACYHSYSSWFSHFVRQVNFQLAQLVRWALLCGEFELFSIWSSNSYKVRWPIGSWSSLMFWKLEWLQPLWQSLWLHSKPRAVTVKKSCIYICNNFPGNDRKLPPDYWFWLLLLFFNWT